MFDLTEDDIANKVTLIADGKDDDGIIEKPFGIFRGGFCIEAKVDYKDFSIPKDAFLKGDEIRELRTFKTADTGDYLERSVWVSGYTALEYRTLVEKLNDDARKDDYVVCIFKNTVKAFSAAERENNFYVLCSDEEKAEIDRQNKYANLTSTSRGAMDTENEIVITVSKNSSYTVIADGWIRGVSVIMDSQLSWLLNNAIVGCSGLWSSGQKYDCTFRVKKGDTVTNDGVLGNAYFIPCFE